MWSNCEADSLSKHVTLLSLYLQRYQKHGAPLSELQAFIAECKDPPNSGKYMVDEESSTFWCLCAPCVNCTWNRWENRIAQHLMHCCKPVALDWWAGTRNGLQGFSYRIMDSTKTLLIPIIKHAYFETEEKNVATCCLHTLHVANDLKRKEWFWEESNTAHKAWWSIQLTYALLFNHLLYMVP